MSDTFQLCLDTNRLAIYDKQVFCIDEDGTRRWFLNGKLHRVNGPAVEYADGTKYWYLNDKRHRVNGPAVEFASGLVWWCLNDRYYSEYDYWKELNK